MAATPVEDITGATEALSIKGSVVMAFGAVACGPDDFAADSIGDLVLNDHGPLGTEAKSVSMVEIAIGTLRKNRIKLYLYDDFAHKFVAKQHWGVQISGPVPVFPDDSPTRTASDHRWCLVLASDNLIKRKLPNRKSSVNDVTLSFKAPAGEATGGGASTAARKTIPSRTGSAAPPLSRTRIGHPDRAGLLAPAGQSSSSSSSGRGSSARGAGEAASFRRASDMPLDTGHYAYTKLEELAGLAAADRGGRLCVYGVVCSFGHRKRTQSGDCMVTVNLVDPSTPDPAASVACNVFANRWADLPPTQMVGDVLRFHRVGVQRYQDRPQLLCQIRNGASWVLLRSKRLAASAFPGKAPAAADGDNGASIGGGGSSSGAGGFDRALWHVEHSGASMTVEPNDPPKPLALLEWFEAALPEMRFNDKEAAIDFAGLHTAPTEERLAAASMRRSVDPARPEYDVDVVVVLAGLRVAPTKAQEEPAVEAILLWDGTGPVREDASRDTAAAVASALSAAGKPLPESQQQLRASTLCPLVVKPHGNALFNLGLRPGMWLRARKLKASWNVQAKVLGALTVDQYTAFNPLPPTAAEVKEIAARYAAATATAAAAGGAAPSLLARGRTHSGGAAAAAAASESIQQGNGLAATNGSRQGARNSEDYYAIGEFLGMAGPISHPCVCRVVSYTPPLAADFVRPIGAAAAAAYGVDAQRLCFLLALTLEDSTGVLEALVSGRAAAELLGSNSPEEYSRDLAAAGAKAEQRLQRLCKGGPNGQPETVEVTLHSYYRQERLANGKRFKLYALTGGDWSCLDGVDGNGLNAMSD